MSVFDPKYSKLTISNRSWSPIEGKPNTLGYEDDYILLYFSQFDVNITGPSSLPYTYLKAGKLITVKIKKPVSFISTNLYFTEDYDGIIPKDSKVITNFDTIKEFYIQPSKTIKTLNFNSNSYDDIYVSNNNTIDFVIYYKIDSVTNSSNGGTTDYHNIIIQIGSKDLSNSMGMLRAVNYIYAQNSLGIGWDYGNNKMTVNENTVVAQLVDNLGVFNNNSTALVPLSSSSIIYKQKNPFSDANNYYRDYRYNIIESTVDASESFEFEYGYAGIDESKINITSYVANTISDISHTAPDGTLYNSVVVTIPKQTCTLNLSKENIRENGRIAPITPTDYLISKIVGKLQIENKMITSIKNGSEIYKDDVKFYNMIRVDTDVQSIGDIETNLNITNIKCDRDSLFYDESYITFNLDIVVNENYDVYISTDNNTFSLYDGDDIELPIRLGDNVKNIYYKLKNNIDNTYTSVSHLEIPVKGYLLNAIDIPNIKVERTSNDNFSIYVENIESIDNHFICSLKINNKTYELNDIDNAYVNITTTEKYINIESYFYKSVDGDNYKGNTTKLIVDTDSLAVIELSRIEYRDPAYIYSKVPTKYYGIYLTLLKLLSDNGETLLQDCVSTCKSNSHKLIALWNMFNTACGAYLNDNEKLAELLIKNIVSQLNIMYDENYDFIQHRVFIGNYTLNNKNNPNEFETVDLYKLTPSEYDICSELELKFTINQTSDIHYIMLPPELDLQYVSFGDTIKTVLFDAEKDINLYKERSWRMADKDTDGTIYWYYSSAGAFNDIITIVCKYK